MHFIDVAHDPIDVVLKLQLRCVVFKKTKQAMKKEHMANQEEIRLNGHVHSLESIRPLAR